jgi:hypothetical protein
MCVLFSLSAASVMAAVAITNGITVGAVEVLMSFEVYQVVNFSC